VKQIRLGLGWFFGGFVWVFKVGLPNRTYCFLGILGICLGVWTVH